MTELRWAKCRASMQLIACKFGTTVERGGAAGE